MVVAVMPSCPCISGLLTGPVTISAFMGIAAVCLSSMGVPPRLPTSLYRADRDTAACAVTESALMVVTAIFLAVMRMMSLHRTFPYSTDPGRIAGSVAVSLFMAITAINTVAMDMPPFLHTAFLGTDFAQAVLVRPAIRLVAVMPMCRNRHCQ